MLDVSVAYNRYRFLGCEFLTWMWFVIEKHPDLLLKCHGEGGSLEIGNRIALENSYQDNVTETVVIKGDDAGLEEGILSLKKGAMVTEMNLTYREGEKKWQFTVKGESFHFTNIKIPEKDVGGALRDAETTVLEKVVLCEKICHLLDGLYAEFIAIRTSPSWKNKAVPAMKSWMNMIRD